MTILADLQTSQTHRNRDGNGLTNTYQTFFKNVVLNVIFIRFSKMFF